MSNNIYDILYELSKVSQEPKKPEVNKLAESIKALESKDEKDITQTVIDDLKHDILNSDIEEGIDDKKIEKKPSGEITVTDKKGNTLTYKDAETAKEFMDDEEMKESFSPGDRVRIRENNKKYAGKSGTVALIYENHTYVNINGREIKFSPKDLIKEEFGMYDDFELESIDYNTNPNLVKFDSSNPEHRQRLQRGTTVILTPILFHDPNADRSGVLSNISKSGFFCKVICKADNKEVNAHLDDIDYADLYNNTVYEDYNKQLNLLLDEDISVTKTENPDNPMLNTITITGTDNSVNELEMMLQNAGISSEYRSDIRQPIGDIEQDDMDGGQFVIDDFGEETDESFVNKPEEEIYPPEAVTLGTSLKGLNGQKRHYRTEYPGDNIIAALEELEEEEDINFDEFEEAWDSKTKTPPEERGKYAGKTVQELRSQLAKLKKSGPHKKGSSEYGQMKELMFAIRAKTGWGKVNEGLFSKKKIT